MNDNLRLTRAFARRLARREGFRVLRGLVSRRKVPDGLSRYGMQHGLLLQKP